VGFYPQPRPRAWRRKGQTENGGECKREGYDRSRHNVLLSHELNRLVRQYGGEHRILHRPNMRFAAGRAAKFRARARRAGECMDVNDMARTSSLVRGHYMTTLKFICDPRKLGTQGDACIVVFAGQAPYSAVLQARNGVVQLSLETHGYRMKSARISHASWLTVFAWRELASASLSGQFSGRCWPVSPSGTGRCRLRLEATGKTRPTTFPRPR
jgi:hypothetical protein